VAVPAALPACELHSALDVRMCAPNQYVAGDSARACKQLRAGRLRRVLSGSRVQHARLTLLPGDLRRIVGLPRIGTVADLNFDRRHRGAAPTKPPARRQS
jgi:hypothetical protein